jgi:hypothetical protein
MFPGSGTQTDPYRCSLISYQYLSAAVEASWRGIHPGEPLDPAEKESSINTSGQPGEYSDHIWRQGWNRYYETRMRPGYEAGADPKLGDLPAIYQPGDIITPPEEPLPDINAKLDAILDNQGTILNDLAGIKNQMRENQNELLSVMAKNKDELFNAINNMPLPVFPPYTGKLGLNMTFNPQK